MVIAGGFGLAACSMGDAAPGAAGTSAPATSEAAVRAPQTDPPATTAGATTTVALGATTVAAPSTAAATPTAPPATPPAETSPPTPPPVIESIEGCSMAPTPPFVGAIPMKRLDHNDRVRQLQQMLTTLGFSVGGSGLDGEFGPDTEDAFEQWQSQQGSAVTGIVCMEDWYALVTATGGDTTATSVAG
jgi:peptidoglycan hydrolase-like protein with peptidoglycan-binding domain